MSTPIALGFDCHVLQPLKSLATPGSNHVCTADNGIWASLTDPIWLQSSRLSWSWRSHCCCSCCYCQTRVKKRQNRSAPCKLARQPARGDPRASAAHRSAGMLPGGHRMRHVGGGTGARNSCKVGAALAMSDPYVYVVFWAP